MRCTPAPRPAWTIHPWRSVDGRQPAPPDTHTQLSIAVAQRKGKERIIFLRDRTCSASSILLLPELYHHHHHHHHISIPASRGRPRNGSGTGKRRCCGGTIQHIYAAALADPFRPEGKNGFAADGSIDRRPLATFSTDQAQAQPAAPCLACTYYVRTVTPTLYNFFHPEH